MSGKPRNILSKAFERSADQPSLTEAEQKIITAVKPIAAQFGKFLFKEGIGLKADAVLWLSSTDRINLNVRKENTQSLPEGHFNSVLLTLSKQSRDSMLLEHPLSIRVGLNKNGGGEYNLVDIHGETTFRTGSPRKLIEEFLQKTDKALLDDILKHGNIHYTADELRSFLTPKVRLESHDFKAS